MFMSFLVLNISLWTTLILNKRGGLERNVVSILYQEEEK